MKTIHLTTKLFCKVCLATTTSPILIEFIAKKSNGPRHIRSSRTDVAINIQFIYDRGYEITREQLVILWLKSMKVRFFNSNKPDGFKWSDIIWNEDNATNTTTRS